MTDLMLLQEILNVELDSVGDSARNKARRIIASDPLVFLSCVSSYTNNLIETQDELKESFDKLLLKYDKLIDERKESEPIIKRFFMVRWKAKRLKDHDQLEGCDTFETEGCYISLLQTIKSISESRSVTDVFIVDTKELNQGDYQDYISK